MDTIKDELSKRSHMCEASTVGAFVERGPKDYNTPLILPASVPTSKGRPLISRSGIMCWYALVFSSVKAVMPEKMFLQVRGLPLLPTLC